MKHLSFLDFHTIVILSRLVVCRDQKKSLYVLQHLILFTDFMLSNVMKLLDIDHQRQHTTLWLKKV